jgi:hypothetical protein
LSGLPLGGHGTLTFTISSALGSDLPIALTAGDTSIVGLPGGQVVLPAGKTAVDVLVTGLATGATAVIGTSARGTSAAIVAVSAIRPDQTFVADAAPAGAAVSNPPAAGTVVAQGGGVRTIRVDLLSTPAADDTPVTVTSTNTAVATATATVTAGQRFADVRITTASDGVATIIVRSGNDVRGITVFVGSPPPSLVPLLIASPVGTAVSGAPVAGQVIASAGRSVVVAIPVVTTAASVDTPVEVSSSNPAVATAQAATLRAGQLTVAVTITTVADGTAMLVLRTGGEVRAVTVFVGTPPADRTPLLIAQPIGASVVALPTLGRVFTPLGSVRTVGVRLFTAPADVDTPVTVTTTDPTVASVTAPALVRAGQMQADLTISSGAAGTATLTVDANGVRRELTIVSGNDPTPGTTPPIVAPPVGVGVIANPLLGRVIGQPGAARTATLGLPLLAAPVSAPTTVTVTTSNAAVVALGGGASTTVVIAAGEQVAPLPIDISGQEGAALLTIDVNGERRELLVIIGNPPASQIPALTAPVVGVRIG